MKLGTKEQKVLERYVHLEYWDECGSGWGEFFDDLEITYEFIKKNDIVNYRIWNVSKHEIKVLQGQGGE
jgi:hypothetical protein